MSKKSAPLKEGPSPESSKPVAIRNSGIQITSVRIQNFRCLRSVEVSLGPTTLLIGENNAGKTSFLDALHSAIGSGVRQFSEDDLWTDLKEKHPPKDRSIIVDILIRPIDKDGKFEDVFPEGSAWSELFGNGIQQDDDDHDFVAIRTKYAWSASKGEYVAERKFLKQWPATITDMEKTPYAEKVQALTVIQLTPISLFLLDAKRDGAEDIRTRGSIWQKLVSEPGLSEEDIETIEGNLSEINEIFVTKSSVLTHLQNHLCGVSDVVNCEKNGVSITPVARRLRDLNKGMDVLLSTSGASSVPLARQGMGTRSLASVLLFRAYMSWKMSRRKSDVLHPFLAIEEPETHLYPHAQRALYGQIESIPGQRIVSTHSPYICAQADIRTFIHFAKTGNETRVSRFDGNGNELSEEDRRRINREVMNTRGDLLFSRFIVIFEGETEEQALPAFAKKYWGFSPHEVGISFIGVGGNGKYTAFIRLAERFNIPWMIFSDGKSQDIQSVNDCLKGAGVPQLPASKNVLVIPNNTDFEGMIAQPENLDLIRDMIVDFIVSKGQVHEKGVQPLRDKFAKKTAAELADEMASEKTAYGARIADALAKHADKSKRIPKPIKDLLDVVRPVIDNPPLK
jgi:putative ATP-dependent endonuclease of the OLD family